MANCEICGRSCGMLGGGREPYTGKELYICNDCGEKFKIVDREKEDVELCKKMVEELISLCKDKRISNIISEYAMLERDKAAQYIEEKKKEEKIQKQREELREKYTEYVKAFKLTTGYNFEGYRITDYKGIISGEVVLGTGFISEFSASLSDSFGIQSNAFADKMTVAKNEAQNRLMKNAIFLGGNAIIGVDFDYINFSNNMIGVSANGTAVVIEKID